MNHLSPRVVWVPAVLVAGLLCVAWFLFGEKSPDASSPLVVDGGTSDFRENDGEQKSSSVRVEVPKNPDRPVGSLDEVLQLARLEVWELKAEHAALPKNEGVRAFAANHGQQLTARFLNDGVRIESGLEGEDWRVEVSLAGFGEADELRLDGPVATYRRDGADEWIRNRADGIEHGFTVEERPAEGGVYHLLFDGDLRVEDDPDSPGDLRLVDEEGAGVLAYRDLKVWDATGRPIDSSMAATPEGAVITCLDEGALYPLVVDPLFTRLEGTFFPEMPAEEIYGQDGDRFGSAVAMREDLAVVTARTDDTAQAIDGGSAYLFRQVLNGWRLDQRLTASDAEANDRFGTSVAMSDDTILLGAPGGSKAYYFEKVGGVWQEIGFVDDGNGSFGGAVAIEGNLMVVGSDNGAPSGLTVGAVSVYERSGGVWQFVEEISPGSLAVFDRFGFSLALKNGVLAVGAPFRDPVIGGATRSNSGEVFVFERSGGNFVLQTSLTLTETTTSNFFGYSLVIDDDGLLIVGASGYTRAGNTSTGQVYCYKLSGASATLTQTIPNPEPDVDAGGDRFGRAMAVSGENLLIGMPGDEVIGVSFGEGAIYHYQASGGGSYLKVEKITPKIRPNGAEFGTSIAIWGDYFVVGAPNRAVGDDSFVGTAYFFQLGNREVVEFETEIPEGDGGGEAFGSKVAIDGAFALVGAPDADTALGDQGGTVTFLKRVGNDWTVLDLVMPNVGGDNDFFGSDVALDGDLAAICASNADSVHIYKVTTGSVAPGVVLTDPIFGDFADSLAVNGTRVAVGATPNIFDGKVTVFDIVDFTSFTVYAELQMTSLAASDRFGAAVSLLDDGILISAPWLQVGGDSSAGLVFYYKDGGRGYEFIRTIESPEAAAGDRFGSEISSTPKGVLISAPGADITGGGDGKAYLFGNPDDDFAFFRSFESEGPGQPSGGSFSANIDGDTVVIGYTRHPGPGGSNFLTGAAFTFTGRQDDWTPGPVLYPPGGDAEFASDYGSSVDVSGSTVIVGQRSGKVILDNGDVVAPQGRAFVYTLNTPRELFDRWAEDAGLAGISAQPTSTPFFEPTSNLAKYALGLDGSQADLTKMTSDGVKGLPLVEIIDLPIFNQRIKRMTFVRRKNAGLIYTAEVSTTLKAGSFQPFDQGVTSVEDIDDEWERVVVEELTFQYVPNCYGRLKIEFE